MLTPCSDKVITVTFQCQVSQLIPGGPWSPTQYSQGPHTDMSSLWRFKVELQDILKDIQTQTESGESEEIIRKKFDITKYSLMIMQRLLSDNKTKDLVKIVDKNARNKKWWQPKLTRSEAEKYLQSREIGDFVVRIGNGKQFFALSLKSDMDRFDHYKIERSGEDKNQWRMVGCSKQFLSLSSLVLHFSFLKEMLAVPLSRDLVTSQ